LTVSYDYAMRYWNLGIQYLHLTQHVSSQVVESGNLWVVAGEPNYPDTEYFEKTKWSDFMLATPLLFNFYHGVELMLKGFVALASGQPVKRSHKLTDLAASFFMYHPGAEPGPFLSKYLNANTAPSPLREFFAASKTDVDMFYEALKYPDGGGGKQFLHNKLHYQSEWGVPFYSELRDDILSARQSFVRLGRSLQTP
jgi:hypothetical protein